MKNFGALVNGVNGGAYPMWQAAIGSREFFEGKARDLGDHVVNRRLEARGGFARDVVFDFVEQATMIRNAKMPCDHSSSA